MGKRGSMGENNLVNLNQVPKICSGEIKSIFSDVCFRGNDSKQDNLYFQMLSGNGFSPKETTPVLLTLTLVNESIIADFNPDLQALKSSEEPG